MSRVKFYAKGACFASIFLLAGFAGLKFYQDDSSDGEKPRKPYPFERSNFEAKLKQDDENDKSDDGPTVVEEKREQVSAPVAYELLKERLVHLDLKGAPPKMSYLTELLPFFRKLGATGLLIEYEDTFPYYGNFSLLRAGYAYQKNDVKALLKLAEDNGLSVIPLVQTFGHMEWVLKHRNFESIREIRRYPQVSCPSNADTLKIVSQLLDQVIYTHPKIQAIHIGADEAYYVGDECGRCKEAIKKRGSKQKLMLHYILQVAKYVKEKHGLRVLTWNDMFENAEPQEMREMGVDKFLEPVVWGYSPNLVYSDYFVPGLFKRYGATFPSLWVASAFKGADGPAQTFVDVGRYAENHVSWMHLLETEKKDTRGVKGMILTGWSRFDHFAVLCELISTGIPSLAVNLQLIQNGGRVNAAYDGARNLLKCVASEDVVYPETDLLVNQSFAHTRGAPAPPKFPLGTVECTYPGSEVTKLIERLRIVRFAADLFLSSQEALGWLADYNLKQQYGGVFMASKGYNKTQELSGHLKSLGGKLRREMTKLYFDDTVDEWLYENVQVHLNKLAVVARSTLTLMHSTEFRNRPLARLELEV